MRSFLYNTDEDWGKLADMAQADEVQVASVWCCTVVATKRHIARVVLACMSRHTESGQQANLMHCDLLHRHAAPKRIFDLYSSTGLVQYNTCVHVCMYTCMLLAPIL